MEPRAFLMLAGAINYSLLAAKRAQSQPMIIELMNLKNFFFEEGLSRVAGGIDNTQNLKKVFVVRTDLFNIAFFKMAAPFLIQKKSL